VRRDREGVRSVNGPYTPTRLERGAILCEMRTFDVVVIGAGVFGCWTAWHLRRAAKRVLLVDAWGPAHSRSSSGGESRIIRMGYGADEIYTRMAMRSLVRWRELFDRRDQPLFCSTGVLWIGREDDRYTRATRETLERAGVPIEIIDGAELARRYPQMRLANSKSYGILEPESGAILSRRAVQTVAEDAIAAGVEYAREYVEKPPGNGRLASIRTTSGQEIGADAFVFACGPWLPKMFPDLLGKRIYPTRQEVYFFAPPAGDRRFTAPVGDHGFTAPVGDHGFTAPHLPVWIDFTDPRGPYGFPDLDGRGVKLAFDYHGPAFDPDSGDRVVSADSVAQARRFIGERFPDLRDAPLTETRVCQYENTSNGDFLIDRHPDFENVWLVGGGSGHGFKHGPAVGEYASGRVMKEAAEEPRFSLASKAETQSRTVY
jgi:sarcosine oxidase